MDEKPERPHPGETDLSAALRRARIENAERADVVAELREIELGRLALLQSALMPVVRQAPSDVDLFDLTLAKGDRPRVFLDMVAFIEMARDRRTYRFFQDTLYGRVLIAESQKIGTIVAACTNYVARRLVERERALAAGAPRDEEGQSPLFPPAPFPPTRSLPAAEAAPDEENDALEAPLHAPLAGAVLANVIKSAETSPGGQPKRGFGRKFLSALRVLLMTLGAITLIALVAYGGWLAWTHRLEAIWTKAAGAPPL
jgi:hypothetical protein